jgi:predicted DNA-binding WGR domain protein
MTVRYGRLGTKGTKRTKKLASARAATKEAKKLAAAKEWKGYTDGAPAARSAEVGSAAAPPPIVVLVDTQGGDLTFLHQNDRDLWFTCYDSPEWGAELRDVERWRFGNKADATKAAKVLASKKDPGRGKTKTPSEGFQTDYASWKKQLRYTESRLPSYEVTKSGPLEIQVHGTPRWLVPRPPPACAGCGVRMTFVASYRGKMERVIGPKRAAYFFACSGNLPMACGEFTEVVYQTEKQDKYADRHFCDEQKRWFAGLHLSEQPVWRDKWLYVVTFHRGELGVPGQLSHRVFKSRADAKRFIDQETKKLVQTQYVRQVKAKTLGPKYITALDELYRANRRLFTGSNLEKGKYHGADSSVARTFKLAPTIAAREVSLSHYNGGSPNFDSCATIIGGTPAWIQAYEEVKCKQCKKRMTFLGQVEAFSLMHSPGINYGDMGSIYLWVCASCRAPFGRTTLQCH